MSEHRGRCSDSGDGGIKPRGVKLGLGFFHPTKRAMARAIRLQPWIGFLPNDRIKACCLQMTQISLTFLLFFPAHQ